MFSTKRISALASAGVLACAALSAPASGATAAESKRFPNCKALNAVYPHGVGRVGARDRSKSGEPVTNFKRSNKLYDENRARDRDGDKVACEKH
jgi:Excalibur calcium-binding domain